MSQKVSEGSLFMKVYSEGIGRMFFGTSKAKVSHQDQSRNWGEIGGVSLPNSFRPPLSRERSRTL